MTWEPPIEGMTALRKSRAQDPLRVSEGVPGQEPEATARDRADAERYRWLKPRVHSANFYYDADENYKGGFTALIFKWPRDVGIGGDLDKNIDAAMASHPRPTASGNDPKLG